MEALDYSLVDWSRAQFALTAIYHWLFVPLTLGLGLILSVMETVYYKTGKTEWKRMTQFWMTLFGINFAVGVATGIILEFQFGTNWSNYSWFVGDIFGAPLAIEGILAFFMESTFIAVMFFGWNKVSKGFHLASTWLTFLGASISAVWILVANAWMQFPNGMTFNPETVRNEMTDFWSVLFSPVAINKILHTVTSSWIVGAAFVVGVSSWFLLKKRESEMAEKSIQLASVLGFAGVILALLTGDGSAQQVAQRQPMKLAAMEGLYEGKHGAGLVAVGLLNPAKKNYDDRIAPFLLRIEIPRALSYLSFRDFNAFVPGISDLMDGGYTGINARGKQQTAISVEEKRTRGQKAVQALADFKKARKAGNDSLASVHRTILETNYSYFGYGFIKDKKDVIPNVPLTFYAFHTMVILGCFFLIFFVLIWYLNQKNKLSSQKWLLGLAIIAIPLAYICSESGWIVAEAGRQPWVIQDIMPTFAAVSSIQTSSVQTTFLLFAILFTIMLVAEVSIMIRQIRKGPENVH
jgi:Cytochrome bd-type quinol oxidase, subunit 1